MWNRYRGDRQRHVVIPLQQRSQDAADAEPRNRRDRAGDERTGCNQDEDPHAGSVTSVDDERVTQRLALRDHRNPGHSSILMRPTMDTPPLPSGRSMTASPSATAPHSGNARAIFGMCVTMMVLVPAVA